MTEEDLKIQYDGFREWAIKIKGYFTCASYDDIKLWESWKKLLYSEITKAKKK